MHANTMHGQDTYGMLDFRASRQFDNFDNVRMTWKDTNVAPMLSLALMWAYQAMYYQAY